MVYIDVLFMLNFSIDCILLYAVGVSCGKKVNLARLSIGGALGGLYCCVTFLQANFLYSVVGKILFSILLNTVVFKWQGIKNLLKILAVFYLISFAFGGTVLAMMYFTNLSQTLKMLINNGEIYLNIPIEFLIFSIIVAYLSVWIYTKICKRNYQNLSLICDVKIFSNVNCANLKALFDTGNSLKDPLSQKNVLVAEFDAIKNILPDKIVKIYDLGKDNDLSYISNAMSECEKFKFRIIPFKSIGNGHGMLLGFKPDKVERNGVSEDMIVAICKQRLSNAGEYNALLGKE